MLPTYFEERLLGFLAISQSDRFSQQALNQIKAVKPLLVAAVLRMGESVKVKAA